jgi:hypothetical protein
MTEHVGTRTVAPGTTAPGGDACAEIALLGDRLGSLGPLEDRRLAPVTAREYRLGAEVRAAVLALDARHIRTWGALASALRRRTAPLLEAASMPALKHVIIVLQDCPLPGNALLSRAERHARRIHVRFAQDWGLNTAVVVVVAAGDTDPSLLRHRIAELVSRPPGLDPAVAVRWDVLRRHTMAQVSAEGVI